MISQTLNRNIQIDNPNNRQISIINKEKSVIKLVSDNRAVEITYVTGGYINILNKMTISKHDVSFYVEYNTIGSPVGYSYAFGASFSAGSNTLTLTSTAKQILDKIKLGDTITGTGIQTDTIVVKIQNNVITISKNTTTYGTYATVNIYSTKKTLYFKSQIRINIDQERTNDNVNIVTVYLKNFIATDKTQLIASDYDVSHLSPANLLLRIIDMYYPLDNLSMEDANSVLNLGINAYGNHSMYSQFDCTVDTEWQKIIGETISVTKADAEALIGAVNNALWETVV